MGSEDLFKRIKARKVSDLKRVSKSRAQMKKILIVCEGEKTEPAYFTDLTKHFRVNTASILEITGDCGSSPLSVVKCAREKYAYEKRRSDPYDKVFCVFDKDAHTGYHSAVSQIHSLQPKGVFEAVTSIPSFEFWLLLHFSCSRKAFSPRKGNSEGAQMLSELRKYLPHYEKNGMGVFNDLLDKLEDALLNNKRVESAALEDGCDNPSTRIGFLVNELFKVRDEFEGKK